MDIRELKKRIVDKTLDDTLLILECPENYFVAEQYIHEISSFKNREIVMTDTLDVRPNSRVLYVYSVEELNEQVDTTLKSVIVKCSKVKTKGLSEYITTIPKLEEWQIKSYFANMLKGITKEQIDTYCKAVDNNIYLVQDAINKLKMFDEINQKLLIESVIPGVTTKINLFDFTTAILKKDKNTIVNLYPYLQQLDSFAVLNTLVKNVRIVLDVHFNQSPQNKEYSEKQYYAIRNNNCGYYSNDKLIELFTYLISLDSKIKEGKLDSHNLIDDIIVNMIGG